MLRIKAMNRWLFIIFMALASPAQATVTNSTASTTYTPTVSTTVFTVTWEFGSVASHLKVTKILISTSGETVLTQGTDYTVTLPLGRSNAFITTTAAVTSTHQIRIDRVIPSTQLTAFKTQGSFRPKDHERAFDKLTMIVQGLSAGTVVATDITTAIDTHEAASDPHTGYALLAGRAGSQHLKGGTASGEDLQLSSTAHGTKGSVIIGDGATDLVWDDVNNKLGIGTASPAQALTLASGGVFLSDGTSLDMYMSGADGVYAAVASTTFLPIIAWNAALSTKGAYMYLYPPDHATKAYFWETFADKLVLTDITSGDTLLSITTAGMTLDDVGFLTLTNDGAAGMTTGTLYGGDQTTDDLTLKPNSTDDTTGNINFGVDGTYDLANDRVGVGTQSPTVTLDVRGQSVHRRRDLNEGTVVGEDDCNAVMFIITAGAKVLALPALSATFEGCEYTFINTRAAGGANITIGTDAADSVFGTCTAAAADYTSTGTAGKGVLNATGTQKVGDRITFVGNYTTTPGWYIMDCAGVWAVEP